MLAPTPPAPVLPAVRPALLRAQFFGRPQVFVAEQRLALPSEKILALVAYLALMGQTSRAQVAQLLWPQLLATQARRNLRALLYRSRSSALGLWLLEHDDGLVLAEPWQADVAQFSQAEDNHDHLAVAAIYSGPFLAELELDDGSALAEWIEEKRHDYQRRYSQALLALLAQAKAEKQPVNALTYALKLRDLDPLEAQWQLEVVELQTKLGRRGAALADLAQYDRLLEEEVGETLPQAATALAERIYSGVDGHNNHDGHDLDAPATALAALMPLVGRERVLAALHQAARPLCLLVGEPGVGKSRIAQALLAKSGGLWLRPSESAQTLPFAALLTLLRQQQPLLKTLPPDQLRELLVLLPELDPEAVQYHNIRYPQERQRFFAVLHLVMQQVLQEQTLADQLPWLVIDDVQWADPMLMEWLGDFLNHFLGDLPNNLPNNLPSDIPSDISSARSLPFRVLLLMRSPQLPANSQQKLQAPAAAAVVGFLQQWQAKDRLERFELAALDQDHLLDLIRRLAGTTAGERFSERLYAHTQGNPFFVEETLRSLFASGLLRQDQAGDWETPFDETTEDYRELPLPETVYEVVLARLSHLSPDTARVLAIVSQCIEPPDLALLQQIAALEPAEVQAALAQAENSHFLLAVRTSDGQQGWRFSHDILRHSVMRKISPEQRRFIQRRLAIALTERQAAPAQLAEHWQLAALPQKAASCHLAAAQQALQVYAYDDVLRHLQATLDDSQVAEEQKQALLLQENLYFIRGQLVEQRQTIEQLRTLARQTHDHELFGNAQLAWANFLNQSLDFEAAKAVAEGVLQDPRALPQQRTRALLERGCARLRLGEAPAARDDLLAVVAEAAHLPPHVLADGYSGLRVAALYLGHYQEADHYNGECRRIYQTINQIDDQIETRIGQGRIYFSLGDYQRAQTELEGGLADARRYGNHLMEGFALVMLARLYHEIGAINATKTVVAAGQHLSARYGIVRFNEPYQIALALAYRHEGNDAAALALLDIPDISRDRQVVLAKAKAKVQLDRCDWAAVDAQLQRLEAGLFDALLDPQWLDLLILRARLALSQGQSSAAQQWLARAASFYQRGERCEQAQWQLVQAELHLLAGDRLAFEAQLAELSQASPPPPLLAEALLLRLRAGVEPALLAEAAQVLQQESTSARVRAALLVFLGQ
jgi:DNA-binding SARP family transcriptional activator